MTRIHDIFASSLKTRLNGQFEKHALGLPGCSPARARAAGISEDIITAASAEALGFDFVEKLTDRPISHDFLTRIPIAFARRHSLIGFASSTSQSMDVAIASLAQLPKLQSLAKILNRPVLPLFSSREEILKTVNAAYQQQSGQAQKMIQELGDLDSLSDLHLLSKNEDLLDVSNRAPVIKLVNLMLFEAVKRRASDVHVQPYEDVLVVRIRVDGILHDVFQPPKGIQEEIISRIKVMGGMNVAERRLAQDGRATVEVGDRVVDLRISSIPTAHGERAVIRLLDKSARLYEMPELGMPPHVLETFRKLIHLDHGIILVTGPTGSGKSTTLYSALGEVNSKNLNILTLEDPIEYQLDGVSQMQVSDKKGMTFASGLRHVLRQDPDIIMVGEIRDSETAHMAIQSALTGHLVFSTLHTNDAASAVARILDLGVEPYLLASSLLGVLAQRLVRKICPKCHAPHSPTPADLRHWGMSEEDASKTIFYAGKGCPNCLQTGYRERLGIFEMLTVSEQIRELVLQRAKSSSIKAAAVANGMTTLRRDGLSKAREGVTTMDEVARVTGLDEF